MAEIAAKTPWWVLPGVVLGILSIVTVIFNLGIARQKSKTDTVTHAQLRQMMSECRTEQGANNSVISEGVKELVEERKQIWELVRSVDRKTSIMETNIDWIMKTMKNGRSG